MSFDEEQCRIGLTSTIFNGNVFVVLGTIVGSLFSAAIGANDVANSIGTSIGSGALTLKQAIVLASIFEFIGSYFLGGQVTKAIASGLLKTELFTDPLLYIAGSFSALTAGFFWLFGATLTGLPVSTTHCIVGAVVGFALAQHGFSSVLWYPRIAQIAASWVLSPTLGGLIAFILFKITARLCFNSQNPIKRTIALMPSFFAVSMFIFSLFFVSKGLKNIDFFKNMSMTTTLIIALGIAAISYIIHYIFFRPRMSTEIPQNLIEKHRPHLSIDLFRPPMVSMAVGEQRRTESIEEVKTRVSTDEVAVNVSDREEMNVPADSELTVRPSPAERPSVDPLITTEVVVESKEVENKEEEKMEKIEEIYDQKFQEQLFKKLQRKSADRLFAPLQILSCAFVATAHGSNDVANASGPLAAIISTFNDRVVASEDATLAPWVIFMAAISLTIGLAVLGHRVIATVGTGITKITNLNGFCVQLAVACTVLLASSLSLPVSTSHILVGAVIGQSFARKTAVNWGKVKNIIVSWIVTLPIAIVTTIIIYKLISFGL
ncbi:hypothetical protein RCL1_003906 [Eukaryota sp. TZLM3-RCL]